MARNCQTGKPEVAVHAKTVGADPKPNNRAEVVSGIAASSKDFNGAKWFASCPSLAVGKHDRPPRPKFPRGRRPASRPPVQTIPVVLFLLASRKFDNNQTPSPTCHQYAVVAVNQLHPRRVNHPTPMFAQLSPPPLMTILCWTREKLAKEFPGSCGGANYRGVESESWNRAKRKKANRGFENRRSDLQRALGGTN